MPENETQQKLIALLQLAYSAERAAAYAYRGHWHSVVDADERARIRQIENEEWHHRELVGGMIETLGAHPSRQREIRSLLIGRTLGFLCHLMGWFAPMYGAGRLESRNVREYETAARYARDCGHDEFIDCLLMMAEVEWQHEYYFRSRVLLHSFGRRLTLWPALPPKETIRQSFARELVDISVGPAIRQLESVGPDAKTSRQFSAVGEAHERKSPSGKEMGRERSTWRNFRV